MSDHLINDRLEVQTNVRRVRGSAEPPHWFGLTLALLLSLHGAGYAGWSLVDGLIGGRIHAPWMATSRGVTRADAGSFMGGFLGWFLFLIVMGMVANASVKLLARLPTKTNSNSHCVAPENRALKNANWLWLLVYSLITAVAFFGEFFTRFSTATFGYYYITVGMPFWMFAYLACMTFGEMRLIPRWLLIGILIVTTLIVAAYSGINR